MQDPDVAAVLAFPMDGARLQLRIGYARDEDRRRGEMNVPIESLVQEIEAASSHDLEKIRQRVEQEFFAAKTSDERGQVLAIFRAMTDRLERHLARGGYEKELASLREANAYEYKSLLYQESLVGLETPVVGADISVERLMAVTNREIAAGRMTEEHSLRKIAVQCAAAPHLSHAELLAKHAKLQAEAASAPKTPPASASVSYALGATLGKRLKGLFRK